MRNQFPHFLLPSSRPKTTTTQTLLPLVSSSEPLRLGLVSDTPPKVWLSSSEVDRVNEECYYCTDVCRQGKQLCLVLKNKAKTAKNDTTASSTQQEAYYLFLHMVSRHILCFVFLSTFLDSCLHGRWMHPTSYSRE